MWESGGFLAGAFSETMLCIAQGLVGGDGAGKFGKSISFGGGGVGGRGGGGGGGGGE